MTSPMKQVKALIITGFGINCEEEMAAAYRLAGAEAAIVHINDILVDGFSIHAFDILNFPGGFSFGDDIASGKVIAVRFATKCCHPGRHSLMISGNFSQRKCILGVCNGFQILVKMGLLPNIAGDLTQGGHADAQRIG